jgi:hypothetical protein
MQPTAQARDSQLSAGAAHDRRFTWFDRHVTCTGGPRLSDGESTPSCERGEEGEEDSEEGEWSIRNKLCEASS